MAIPRECNPDIKDNKLVSKIFWHMSPEHINYRCQCINKSVCFEINWLLHLDKADKAKELLFSITNKTTK